MILLCKYKILHGLDNTQYRVFTSLMVMTYIRADEPKKAMDSQVSKTITHAYTVNRFWFVGEILTKIAFLLRNCIHSSKSPEILWLRINIYTTSDLSVRA